MSGQPRRCEIAQPASDIGTGLPVWLLTCGKPAAAVYRYACIHEHVSERATCAAHEPQAGIVGCRECFEAGHECPMTAELMQALA